MLQKCAVLYSKNYYYSLRKYAYTPLCMSSFSVHQTFNSKKNLIWYSKMKISKQNSFFFMKKQNI